MSVLLPLLIALPIQNSLGATPVSRVERTDSIESAAPNERGGPSEHAEQDDARARAIHAVESGDLDEARRILTEMIVDERMTEARALLEAGRSRDALTPLDEVLQLTPKKADAWFLRGRAALATADTDSQPAFFYQDALANLEKGFLYDTAAQNSADKLLLASRAAYQNLEFDKAYGWAKRGMALIDASGKRPALDEAPERTLANASYRVYIDGKQNGRDTAESFAATEDALTRLLGRQADDAKVWTDLAELYQWEGEVDVAIETLGRGLSILPENSTLHERLTTLARQNGGRERVLEFYSSFNAEHPDSPLGTWWTAVETLYVAIDAQLAERQDSSATYEEAEKLFRRCRELEPTYEDSCISYELICRNGIGWCRYNNGDMVGAKDAFLSMEDLKEGGLEWELAGQLPSGVMGLQFVAGKYAADGQRAESLAKAAEIFDYLHAYKPENSDFANNAGFFNRDTAVLLEVAAMAKFRRADESTDATEAETLRAEAAAQRARAQEIMERSYAAYCEASRLVPDDVRVVNDTGLIMTYYLRSDVAAAERYLYSAVEMGETQVAELRAQIDELGSVVAEQKAAASATAAEAALGGEKAGDAQPAERTEQEARMAELEDTLDNLLEAWGDAHQNLGVLYLTVTGEPERALEWFEKSVAIGPLPRVPRVFLTEGLIPLTKAVLDGDTEAVAQVPGIWHHNGPAARTTAGETKE